MCDDLESCGGRRTYGGRDSWHIHRATDRLQGRPRWIMSSDRCASLISPSSGPVAPSTPQQSNGGGGGAPVGDFFLAVANLRARADKVKSSAPVGTIAKGFIINVSQQEGDWFRIYLNERGDQGWIQSRNKDRVLVEPYPNKNTGMRLWREQIEEEQSNPTVLSPSNFSPQPTKTPDASRGREPSPPRQRSPSPPPQRSVSPPPRSVSPPPAVQTPAAAPTPVVDGNFYRANIKCSVRDGPSSKDDIIFDFMKGAVMKVLEVRDTWIRIEFTDEKNEPVPDAWVMAQNSRGNVIASPAEDPVAAAQEYQVPRS